MSPVLVGAPELAPTAECVNLDKDVEDNRSRRKRVP